MSDADSCHSVWAEADEAALAWGSRSAVAVPAAASHRIAGDPDGESAAQRDGREYRGSGQGNQGGRTAEAFPIHHRPHCLRLTPPPLAALFFVSRGAA